MSRNSTQNGYAHKGSWQLGSIARAERLASNQNHPFKAWVKKVTNVANGLPFQLTISLDHGMPHHRLHQLDLDVASG